MLENPQSALFLQCVKEELFVLCIGYGIYKWMVLSV